MNMFNSVIVLLPLLSLTSCNTIENSEELNNKSSLFKPRSAYFAENPKIYNIGAVLNSEENAAQFFQAIEDVNYEPNILPPGVTINGHYVPIESNPVKNVLNICGKLIPSQVYAVIVDDKIALDAITYTTTFHNIPTIGISNRQIILSDKSVYGTFLRTVSPYSHEADVWIEILNYFNYNCVVLIHSNDIDGRSTQHRFEHLADASNLKIENVIEFKPTFPDIKNKLNQTKYSSSCRVFILYTNSHDSEAIFEQINMLNMSESGYVWIVSEQALDARNKPLGLLGLRLTNVANTGDHIKDSVFIFAKAIQSMYHIENIVTPKTDCKDLSRPKWESGSKLFSYMKKQTLVSGKTGCVAFDARGDRIHSDYHIVNVRHNELTIVGQYYFSTHKMSISFNESDIIWPGSETKRPIGYEVATHLRVATIAEKPFVYVLSADSDGECSGEQIACPVINSSTGVHNNYCCEGYCIDLLKNLAHNLNFTYSLHQVEDGLYGGYNFDNSSGRKIWSGLIGQLYYDKADMVVAPLTINPERSLAIDFTKPFMYNAFYYRYSEYQGITILQKKQSINRHRHPLASFLQPFQNSLWLLVGVSVHVVALALYLLDRFSPFGRYKLPNCEATEEDALNLSSAVWFAWGVLLNSGIGEGTPRSFSGRVLGMVWAGFAMIVVASYTANLAAFLVLDRPATALTGINDARLRNPSDEFKFTTVKDSAVDMYFRRQIELSNMHSKMQENYYYNTEDAVSAVKSGALHAFIWDSARLEYESAIDCELSTSGELFGRSGYGFGLQKENNFWTEKVTLHLLTLHEIGFMEDLDNKWILHKRAHECEANPEHFPATLGLKNMAGVFILVSAGIFGGVGLILFEIVYKKHQTRKQRRMDLARNAVDRWKTVVERKSLLESFNKSAKQKYKHRQQFIKQEKFMRESKQQFSLDESSHAKHMDTKQYMPYTVEKGINEIKSESSQPSTHFTHRPKLKRDFSMTTESDIETLPMYSDIDLPQYSQIPTTTTKSQKPKLQKALPYTTKNYLSLV